MDETVTETPQVPRIMPHGGTLAPMVTSSEQARSLARKRWDTAERMARKALQDATGAGNWALGAYELVRKQADTAMGDGRQATAAAAFVWRAAGLGRERASGGADIPEGGAQLTLSGPAVEALASLLGRKAGG